MRTPKRHVNPATGEVYYRVRYRHGGRSRALPFYGPKAEAEALEFCRLLDALKADRAVAWWNANLNRAELEDSETVDEWFARYLRSLTGVTEGTRVTYRRTFARVWSPEIGEVPVRLLTREDVADVVNQLSATRSDKTVRNAFGVLSSCLKVAVRDGLIPASPAVGIRLPRRTEHEETEMRFLTHEEWARLYDALPRHYRPLFTFLIGTGARWGEAEALTVGDIVLQPLKLRDGSTVDRWVVRITKAAKWNASKATRTIGPTKTRKSRRTVTLPPEVMAELEPLLEGRPKSARLFLAARGGQLRHRTVYDDWKKAVERAGLDPHPRMHDLRHTHVAWLIASGRPLPVVQARLGHEHISTTIDRYGHLLPELDYEAAEAASVVMRRTPLEITSDDPEA